MLESSRAGRYIEQVAGYKAFIPNPLPPTPEITIDQEIWDLLSQADRALGRLDGATDALPNPDLLVSHVFDAQRSMQKINLDVYNR
jgi:Fic family protein